MCRTTPNELHHLCTAALFTAVLLSIQTRHAHGQNPFEIEGEFLNTGVNIGVTQLEGPRFQAGIETAMVKVKEIDDGIVWGGGYLDGIWVTQANAFRHSIGTEAGFYFLGVEAGYLGEVYKGKYYPGFRLGGVLTVGVASLYTRFGYRWGVPDKPHFAEVGLLFKYPLDI